MFWVEGGKRLHVGAAGAVKWEWEEPYLGVPWVPGGSGGPRRKGREAGSVSCGVDCTRVLVSLGCHTKHHRLCDPSNRDLILRVWGHKPKLKVRQAGLLLRPLSLTCRRQPSHCVLHGRLCEPPGLSLFS